MSEPQRVLMVFESFGVGGAEVAALNLLKALGERGHSCEAVALWAPYTLAASLEDAGIATHRLDLEHRWRLDQGMWRLTRLVRNTRPTVIHGQLFFSGLYTALTRLPAPSPSRVVTYQNLGYESYPASTAWHKVRKRIDRYAMRHGIDAHVAVSRSVRRHYAEHLGVEASAVIPNGLDAKGLGAAIPPERESVLAARGISDAGSVVLCPARMVHEKGHRFLLEAVKLLDDRGQAPTVLLAGDGPLRAEVVAQVSSQELGAHVHVLGAVPSAELIDLMRVSDVVVMPSTHEGFPVAAAEASAVGTPVVASRVGGLPDLIVDGSSGRLVPPADPAALSVALSQLLSDESLRLALGREARTRTVAVCDIDEVARRYEEVYESIPAAAAGREGD